MTEHELSLEADRLLVLTHAIRAAMDDPESDELIDLLNQYEQITARIKQFSRINKSAVLACAKLRDVMSREADLLSHATKTQEHISTELQAVRQTVAITNAYSA
jgi:hypothetical protein